jgi:hypothetical protein
MNDKADKPDDEDSQTGYFDNCHIFLFGGLLRDFEYSYAFRVKRFQSS